MENFLWNKRLCTNHRKIHVHRILYMNHLFTVSMVMFPVWWGMAGTQTQLHYLTNITVYDACWYIVKKNSLDQWIGEIQRSTILITDPLLRLIFNNIQNKTWKMFISSYVQYLSSECATCSLNHRTVSALLFP